MTEDEARERYDRMVAEEEVRPLTYFKHDALAHDDPKLQELRDAHGMESYGRYWLLVERLAGREGHAYSVATPNALARFARDVELEPDQARAFLDALDACGLIERELYRERGRVYIDRILRNARESAEYVARRRVNGILTAEKRWGKQQAGGNK